MKISVSAPSGLEGVTKRELYNLLKVDAPANNGSLTFNGDIVSVDFATGEIVDETTGESFKAVAFPEFINGIIENGGLLSYVKRKQEGK